MEKSKEKEQSGEWSKPWRSFMDSSDAAFRSFHHSSSSHLRHFQNHLPQLRSHYSKYEDAFFLKCKEGLAIGIQNPAMTAGITLAAVFLFAKGPRRFLLRQTVGRLQSEEARYVRVEKNVKNLNFSVDMMKKESKKLLERATFAEKEMTSGRTGLMSAGKQVRHLAKSVDHVQTQAADLMDLLRMMPGREALQLRAEVASVASLLKQQRTGLEKKMMKLNEMGIPV